MSKQNVIDMTWFLLDTYNKKSQGGDKLREELQNK